MPWKFTHLVPRSQGADLASDDLVSLWLAGRSKSTVRAYAADLRALAAWMGAPSPADAARRLLMNGPGSANATVTAWRGAMLDAGLSPATIRRRISAVRSLVAIARRVGLVVWALDVDSVKHRAYRDTRGPGRVAVLAMVEAAADAGHVRDAAVLRMLFNPALRRGELVRLDVDDVDLVNDRVRVVGKGQREPRWVTMPPETARALRSWLGRRGTQPGPLFVSERSGARLLGSDVYRIVKRWGGPDARPHGLRHSGITHALDVSNGNVRAVAKFSRHADHRTVMIYDDERRDVAGEIARMVG